MNRNDIQLRVLHLEDSARDHELIREILDEDGIHCEFSCVKSRDDFMASLQREEFDLILSDFAMAGYDGLSALQTVHDTKPEIPFIFVSGTIGEERAVESLKNGATDYVLKGNLRRLAPAILRALREAKARAERERTEAALRASESRYRALFEKMDEGFCVVEMLYDSSGKADDYRFLEINPAFEKQTGLQQALGRTIRQMVPNHEAHWFEMFAKVVRTGEAIRFESPANARQRFYDVFAFRVGGDGSQRVGILFNEITERKLAAERIAEQAALLDKARDAIVVCDLDLRITYWNKSAERVFGWTAGEAIGRSDAGLLHVDPNTAQEAREQVIRTGEWVGEMDKVTKDGQVLVMQGRWTLVRNDAGQPKSILTINTDITKRKRAEERLRESEALYQSLVENLPQGIFRKDLAGKFTFANQRFGDLMGRSLPDLLGKSDADLFPRELAGRYQSEDKRIVETARLFESVEELEASGGKKLFVQTLKTPLRAADGRVIGVQGIIWDIREKKNLEAQYLRSQRMESLGTLAGGIAHDLNNVLAPILMSIEILRLKYSEPDAERILTTVESSARRGAEMVKQVLTFARGVQGERVSLQVGHLLKEVAKILKQTVPKVIEIRTVLRGQLWPTVGDATQLHQVLMNLCVNARDAMPNGGTLTLEAGNLLIDESFAAMNVEAKPGAYVQLSVRDTGTGIPPQVLERMFEPFFTTKTLEKGTGLGLSTVRGIVKSHGGFVKVYSEVGKGSDFQVFLPAQQSTTTEVVEIQERVLPIGNGEVVLVVDDEAAILNIAKQTLEAFGYQVRTASDGAEAIGLCAQHGSEIKLMVTDMMMPVLDGLSTIKGVRRIAPLIKIIAATGLGTQADLTGPNQTRIDGFLQKPYTAEQLLQTVHHVLRADESSESKGTAETIDSLNVI